MNKQNSSRHTSRYYGDETSHYDRYPQAKSLCATSYKVIRVIRAKRRMQGPFKFEICKWCALLGNLQIGGSHITPIINLYLFLVSKSIFCRSMKGHTCMVTDLESKSFQPGITQTPSHTQSNARTQTDRQTDRHRGPTPRHREGKQNDRLREVPPKNTREGTEFHSRHFNHSPLAN